MISPDGQPISVFAAVSYVVSYNDQKVNIDKPFAMPFFRSRFAVLC